MRIERIVAAACLLLATGLCQDRQDWTHYVRIGGHGLGSGNADEILRSATASHVFGIEVDNDITGRYASFLDPAAKLEAIREVAKKAHEAGNYAFVYIAGTECITANAAGQPHTMAKDHPDWLQRNIKGEPAVFGGGSAFWIREGDRGVRKNAGRHRRNRRYDETGAELTRNPVHRLLGFTVAGEKQTSSSGKKFIYYPRCPARAYYAALRTEFDGAAGRGNDRQTRFRGLRQSLLQELVDVSHFRPAVEIDASPFAATQIASVDGSTRVFIANFKGLKANEIAQQMPETNVRVVFHTGRNSPVYLLPFLGQRQKLECVSTKASLACSIPEIAKGGVIWQESTPSNNKKH